MTVSQTTGAARSCDPFPATPMTVQGWRAAMRSLSKPSAGGNPKQMDLARHRCHSTPEQTRNSICQVVLELTLSLRRNPVPYLLAVAMASNIGSAATITGNPQNMMIGSFSQIPYAQFTARLAPVALVGLVLTFILIALFPSRRIRGRRAARGRDPAGAHPPRADAARTHCDGRADRPVLCGPAACKGGNRHRRAVAAHPAGQERARLCRDRLVAAADVLPGSSSSSRARSTHC